MNFDNYPAIPYNNRTINNLKNMGINSALKARIKHARKNTKKGKLLAKKTPKLNTTRV